MKLQDTFTAIDFEKDFANHMRELASEISCLHKDGLTYTDELETLYDEKSQESHTSLAYDRFQSIRTPKKVPT